MPNGIWLKSGLIGVSFCLHRFLLQSSVIADTESLGSFFLENIASNVVLAAVSNATAIIGPTSWPHDRGQLHLVAEQVSSSGGSVSAGAPALGALPPRWYITAIYYI